MDGFAVIIPYEKAHNLGLNMGAKNKKKGGEKIMDEILNDVFKDVNEKLNDLMREYQREFMYYDECVECYAMYEYQSELYKREAKIATLGLLLCSVNTEDLKKKLYNEAMGK